MKPLSTPNSALELAEQWKGRADDAGLLARTILLELGRWIPVSAELPDDDDFATLVVAVEDGKFIPENMLIVYATLLAMPRNRRTPPITHWMQLPAAPSRYERK